MSDSSGKRWMKALFNLAAGSGLTSLIVNFVLRSYLFLHRPLAADPTNGFIIPMKLIGGLSYVTKYENDVLEYLLIYSVLSFAVAFWLQTRSK